VEAKTPIQEKNSDIAVEDVSKDKAETINAQALPIDLSAISEDKIKMAEELGIPIRQFLGWMASVEQRFQIIEKNLNEAPQKVVEALRKAAEKRQREIQEQMKQSPQKGSALAGMSPLISTLLPAILGSSQQSNPFMEKMMNIAFEKMISGMELSNALTKAMIIKLAPELADTLTSTVVKKE